MGSQPPRMLKAVWIARIWPCLSGWWPLCRLNIMGSAMSIAPGEQPAPSAPPADVDAICDVFEAAWYAGQAPRVEDFLPRGDVSHQDVLLRELLLAEWDLCRRHAQHVELQTYLERFAESSHLVAELWHAWHSK